MLFSISSSVMFIDFIANSSALTDSMISSVSCIVDSIFSFPKISNWFISSSSLLQTFSYSTRSNSPT